MSAFFNRLQGFICLSRQVYNTLLLAAVLGVCLGGQSIATEDTGDSTPERFRKRGIQTYGTDFLQLGQEAYQKNNLEEAYTYINPNYV